MKKLLFSMLLSTVLGLAVPALDAEAAQNGSESFFLEVEEPVIQAAWNEWTEYPVEEFEADTVAVAGEAYTIEGKTHILLQADELFRGYRPDLTVYDEEGNIVSGSLSASYYTDGDIPMRFSMDAFTGTKTYTFIFHYNAGPGLEKVAVKKATVTAKEWQGNISIAKESVYELSEYSAYFSVYLPATVDTDGMEVYLYDGDVTAGKVAFYSYGGDAWSESSSLYLASVAAQDEVRVYLPLDETTVKTKSGQFCFARQLASGKAYAIKAVSGNKSYDLGSYYVDGTSYVDKASAETMRTATKPVVSVDAYGYDFNDMVVQLIAPETNKVMATSEGGTFIPRSKNGGYFILSTNNAIEELEGCDIVVSLQGEELYRDSYYMNVIGMTGAYYNYTDRAVVVKTIGLPNGTVCKAEIGDGYYGEGTVMDNTVVFRVMKDRVECALPAGGHIVNVTYTYEENECNYTYYSLYVNGKETEDIEHINKIDENYHESGKEFPIEITISQYSMMLESGDFTARLLSADTYEQIGSDIALTATINKVEGVDSYTLTGTVPATATGNYYLDLYKGSTYEGTYSLYVMDADKVYSTGYYSVKYEDGKCGVGLWMSEEKDFYDVSKFKVTVTDILGKDIGVDVTPVTDAESSGIEFKFNNVPQDVNVVNVTFAYNGKQIIDSKKIASETAAVALVSTKLEGISVGSEFKENSFSYILYSGFTLNMDATAYVVESGTIDLWKTWKLTKGDNYLTLDMLEGLDYDDAKVSYDICFVAKDGSVSWYSNVYLGYEEQITVVDNGIGKDESGAYVLYQNSQIATGYNGMYYWAEEDAWVLITAGKLDTTYTGFSLYNDIWWYIVNGYVDFNYVGVAELNGSLWYVKNGTIDFSMNGLGYSNDDWYYIVNGQVDGNYSGTAYINDAWWYVVNGKVDFSFTGLTFVNNKWWYVNAGRIDFNYCGPCEFNGATWIIINGEIDYTSDGLVFTGLDWYFVKDGLVRTDFTGLAFINDDWWYVVNGKIDFAYCGLFDYDNEKWYVQGGKIDFSYNNVYYFNDIWWYIETGKVNFGYNGLAYTQFNDKWWYVIDGVISFDYTGAAYANEKYWYVERGEIDFQRNGKVIVDGVEKTVAWGEILM